MTGRMMQRAGEIAPTCFYTISEIAILLRVPEATIRYWKYLGRIRGVRFGKRVCIPHSELVRYLEEKQVGLSKELHFSPAREQ